MTPTNHSITSSEREGLTWATVARFLSLPFQPSRLSTYLAAKRFDEVPLNTLLQDGIKGVLIDADGTIGPHHTLDIDASILAHIQKMLQQKQLTYCSDSCLFSPSVLLDNLRRFSTYLL